MSYPDPAILDDNDELFDLIEEVLRTDPMQARWQRGIYKHQAHLNNPEPNNPEPG